MQLILKLFFESVKFEGISSCLSCQPGKAVTNVLEFFAGKIYEQLKIQCDKEKDALER